MELIAIMNYSRGEVYISQINWEIYEEIQQFFDYLNEKHDLNISEENSYWMTSKELEILHL